MTRHKEPTRNIDLQFRSTNGRSFLSRQYVRYPYHITRMLYEDTAERAVPKVILQSLSGGIYKDEELRHNFHVGPSAKIDIRTQGSTIIHDARGGSASSTTDIVVEPDATLIYVPEPQILFNGACFTNTIRVHGVNEAGHVIVSDSFLAYDPVEEISEANFKLTMTSAFLDREGNKIALDKSIVNGQSHRRLMNGHKGFVSFMMCGRSFDEDFLSLCFKQTEEVGAFVGYSVLPGGEGYVVKALVPDGVVLSKVLDIIRQNCRVLINGLTSESVATEAVGSFGRLPIMPLVGRD